MGFIESGCQYRKSKTRMNLFMVEYTVKVLEVYMDVEMWVGSMMTETLTLI